VQPNRVNQRRKGERGVVVLLVAVVLLFVVAAMAALAIDLVTFYTARSEAQLAADAAALAGARVLANSGMTSNPADTSLSDAARPIAEAVARQVAQSNDVGGRNLIGAGSVLNCPEEVCVVFNNADTSFGTNPRVTVQVKRADLPTFFARIWGSTIVTVKATATAEAYNPSGADVLNPPARPIAPTCVKPWVLPNMAAPTTKIFDENTGAIQNASTLLGQSVNGGLGGLSLTCLGAACGGPQAAQSWNFFPGMQTSFPAPGALQACGSGLTPYQQSVSGCVQQPVSCGGNSGVYLDFTGSATGPNTQVAVDCLTHAQSDFGDRIDPSWSPGDPFQYVGGNDNPVAGAQGAHVMVSDSLVTVPVVDVDPGANYPVTNPVKVIGFVQFFLNPTGGATPVDHVPATIVNMAGCGKNTTLQPILGNGASPVPVRLITPP